MMVFRKGISWQYFVAVGVVASLLGCFAQKPELSVNDAKKRPAATDNFYEWANHDWLMEAKIPDDKPGINNFVDIQNNTLKQQKVLLDELAAAKSLSVDQQKLAIVYHNLSDMEKRNRLGISPLVADLQKIDQAESYKDIQVLFAELQKQGAEAPLLFEASTDFMDSNSYLVFVGQGGLGLERELYLKDDERAKKQRQLYQDFVAQLFLLANIAQSEEKAKQVLALEVALARIQWSNVDNRDMSKIYNKKSFKELQSLTKKLWVKEQLVALGFPAVYSFNVMQPSYVTALSQVMKSIDVQTWKLYIKARLLTSYASLLSEDFQQAVTQYQIARGLYKESPPQWKKSINYINGYIGMLMGKAYVARYFDEGTKNKVEGIAQRIVNQYRVAIANSPRFAPETKKSALNKLDKMKYKIGYPDVWQDYSSLHIADTNLVENHRAIVLYEHQRNIARLGKPVDRDEWAYPPQVINAYYDPTQNTFVLLAGILQPPFFEKNADLASNFGSLGFVIGHEIGHGYDDSGRRFDGDGNMKSWWNEQDAKAFNSLKDILIAQADIYEVLPGLKLNGALEVGEIMGDLSGAEIALAAYTHYATESHMNIDREQRVFFIQLAKTWRSIYRDEYVRQMVESDPHPPSEFRTNGIVKNMDRFHELFKTKPGDAMYLEPEKRVRLW